MTSSPSLHNEASLISVTVGLDGRVLIFLEFFFPFHVYVLSVWITPAAEDSILGKVQYIFS